MLIFLKMQMEDVYKRQVLALLEVNGMDFIGLEDLSRTVDDEQAV